jgi:hypothetical protein
MSSPALTWPISNSIAPLRARHKAPQFGYYRRSVLTTDLVTFGLAVCAYALLATVAIATLRQRRALGLRWAMAAVTVLHVVCVWLLRFGGSFAKAVEKGWAGAILFHAALALTVALPFLKPPWTTRAALSAYAIVSAGAVGAVFKYSFVAMFRGPVLAIFLSSLLAIGVTLVHRRAPRAAP